MRQASETPSVPPALREPSRLELPPSASQQAFQEHSVQALLQDSHLPALQSQRIQQASLPELPSFQPREQPERRVRQERRTSVRLQQLSAAFFIFFSEAASAILKR